MNKKPNILMIVTDQEYAHQPMPAEFALPARDRIRARGVTFNHHHCTTTVCTPSRSVIYTGRHTPHTRMFDNTNFAWIDDMKAEALGLTGVNGWFHVKRLARASASDTSVAPLRPACSARTVSYSLAISAM